jgi:uncharacterized membrane protein
VTGNVTLSLAAFFLTFFPMLAVGIALGIWASRRPARRREDLRKTVDGTVRIQKLLDECKRKEI